MVHELGSEKVIRLLELLEENVAKEQLRKEEARKKDEEKATRIAAERASAKQKDDRKLKERSDVVRRYLSTLADWAIEDLEEDIVSGRVVPKISAQEVAVTFVLRDGWHNLTGELQESLVKILTYRFRTSWDSVETKTATEFTWSDRNSQEYRVGIKFMLTKHR